MGLPGSPLGSNALDPTRTKLIILKTKCIESIVWLLSTYSMSLLQSLRTWGMVRNISVDSILSYEDTNESCYVMLHFNNLFY